MIHIAVLAIFLTTPSPHSQQDGPRVCFALSPCRGKPVACFVRLAKPDPCGAGATDVFVDALINANGHPGPIVRMDSHARTPHGAVLRVLDAAKSVGPNARIGGLPKP